MPKYIVLAEDDADDQLLFTEALKQISGDNTLTTVPNGMLMLDLLNENKSSLPDVVVLDINMPGMSGIDCLKIIRSEPEFNTVPVVMLSTTTDPQTVDVAYRLGANHYAVKPGAFDDLKRIVGKIADTELLPSVQSRDKDDFILGSNRS